MEPKIKRNRLKCLLCGDTIESKYRHDFQQCRCGEAFVDGGKSYVRYGCTSPANIKILTECEEQDEIQQGP